MQKIIPNLWFDSQAEEAAKLYTSLFQNSRIGRTTRYGKAGYEIHRQPEGKLMTIEFELEGQSFIGLNGGPVFKFTPAISFLVACQTKDEVDALWQGLSAGGQALMELGEYPFSPWYGWTADRFGLSWQVMAMGDRPIKQKIIPTLMYVGAVCGRAEEAVNFYASVFHNAKVGDIDRYGRARNPTKRGPIKHASFTLEGQQFAAMESAYEHKFGFNEAVSLVVRCETQAEIDLLLGQAHRRRGPASAGLRLAEGQVRRFLAGHAHHPRGDAPGQRQGQGRTRDRGLPQDEEVRYRRAEESF